MAFFEQVKVTGANGATLDGTAGSPSTGVVTVQGVPSGTAVKVDGSAVTQPVSGTVSINAIPAGGNVVGGVELVDSAGTNKASISAGGAVKVDGSGVTQPVSGSVSVSGTAAVQDVADGTTGSAVPTKAIAVGAKDGSGNLQNVLVDASGFLKVNVSAGSAGNGAASNTGSAVPVQADYLGAKDGSGNLVGLLAESVTNPNLRVAIFNGSTEASVTAGNALKVDGSAVTQPVSGTVAATQSGTWTAATNADAAIAAGAAPSKALVAGGVFNSSAPAPTNGQTMALQLDQAGNQRVFSGTALVALSAQGTALNSTQTIFTNSGAQAALVQLTQTSTLTAGAVTFEFSYDGSTWVTAPAQFVLDPNSATFAQTGQPYSVQASTNKQFLILMNGAQGLRLRTSTAITGTGSVTPNYALLNFSPLEQVQILGTPAVTISGTALVSVSGSVNTSDGNAASQGSTTSGQKGFLELGAVTTSAPSYTTAQSSPLSLTTAGALRVDGSGVTQPVSGTVAATQSGNWTSRIVGNSGSTLDAVVGATTAPTNGLAVLGQYNTTIPAPTAAQTVAIQLDSTGSQYVNGEGRKATYSAFASFTSTNGDIALLPGSGTKTIRVTRVEVSLTTTGTAAIESVSLLKRSTADTAGTSSAMTAVPHDSNFSAASAAPLSYTVAPTQGTLVGTLRGVLFNDQSASLPGSATWLWEFGTRNGASSIVLRGTAQQLCVSLGTAVATQTAQVSFEWTEE
jgi:hypothetical protein